MTKRKILIILISFFILLAMIVASWFFFAKKKTVSISGQESVNSEQQISEQDTGISEQESINSDQEIVNNNQQETVNSEQQSVTSHQSSVISNEGKNVQEDQETEEKNEKPTGEVGKIVSRLVSWGFEKSSGRKIDTIIIHSSYDALGGDPYDIDGIIAEYKQYGVSAHYLIARSGKIYQLVENKNIAYHAGESKVPDGRTGVNAFSIGIEMVNTTSGKFTSDQYEALNSLIKTLKKQYSIKYILGHDDIAPGRKTDPWNINWDKVDK